MSSTLIRRAGRGASLALLVVVALALAGGNTLAATTIGHSGTTGTYSFVDTSGNPGGRCVYQGTAGAQMFDHARITGPSVWWPASSSSSSGTVGWRLKLQNNSSGSWVTVRTGSLTYATAHKHSAAMFANKGIAWAAPITGHERVLVVLVWYNPGLTVMGKATVLIQHYRRGYDGSVGSTCIFRHPDF